MIRRLLLLVSAFLLVGAAEPPRKPIILSPEDAAKEGRALVAEIISLKPNQSSISKGTLTIRSAKPKRTEVIPVRFEVVIPGTGSSNWSSTYEANGVRLEVVHNGSQPPRYRLEEKGAQKTLSGDEAMIPFAGSDFWVADLGLDFFHWPVQNVVRKELNRTRFCRVLESINPKPAPGGYSRVKSWIDNQSDAIVQAEAYDAKGKLLKIFLPKRVKEIEGQWQLQEMQISNLQTESRTTIEFELGGQ